MSELSAYRPAADGLAFPPRTGVAARADGLLPAAGNPSRPGLAGRRGLNVTWRLLTSVSAAF
eukprot:6647576-Pyramimonas_sp.AAC.2